MNQLAAMRETIELALARNFGRHPQDADTQRDGINFNHLLEMEHNAKKGEYSEAKLGRHLGWMQGVLCATGYMTLNEAKELNRRHSNG